jgi:hypothetical protein
MLADVKGLDRPDIIFGGTKRKRKRKTRKRFSKKI